MVRKGVSCSIILILLAASGAFGGLLQNQGMDIGSVNLLDLLQGNQNGQSTQSVTIDLNQVGDGGHTVANINVSSGTRPLGGLLGASSLFGIGGLGFGTQSLLGTQSLFGLSSLLGPQSLLGPTNSMQMALMKARLGM
ncbi:hypothetical protein [Anaerobaca lacustris]|uniref:Uncharacterized protein n=1 Tax=Anaerobaca lacustris TaxID=3044600 RepID=A0AAW6TZ55_9BACT|nr:hypothetical protein [Sedimentisphaerales bacterium M17dextr]